MAVSYLFTHDCSLALINVSGVVLAEDIITDIEKYHADHRYQAGTPEIAIIKDIVDLELDFRKTIGLYERMTYLYQLRAPHTRMALLAPDDLAFGISRMFQTIASAGSVLNVGVFRQEGPALGWLKRSETELGQLTLWADQPQGTET